MRTTRFCGLEGEGRVSNLFILYSPLHPTPGYPTPDTLPKIPIPQIPYPQIPCPQKGHGTTRDQEGIWHQRYPNPP